MIRRLLRRLGEIARPPDAPHAGPARRWLHAAIARWTDRGGTPARLSRAGTHPTDEEIVCLMDGELPPRDAARVRRHLEICWSCRHRRTQVQQTIDAFMADCAESLAQDDGAEGLLDVSRLPRAAIAALHGEPPARPSAAARAAHGAHAIAQRLRAGAEIAGRSLRARPMHGRDDGGLRETRGWRPSPAVAVRLGAAVAAASVILFLSTGSPVSARQLMRQADRAERAALDLSPSPVVYQRLRVARRGGRTGSDVAGTWDVWTDVARRRHRAARIDAGSGGAPGAGAGAGAGAGRSRGDLDGRTAAVAGAGADADADTVAAAARAVGRARTNADNAAAAATAVSAGGSSSNSSSGARRDADVDADVAADSGSAAGAAADDLPDALFAALQAHGADAAWPVSIRSHEQWRADARQPRDSVIAARTEAGEPALLLDTTTADSGDEAAARETSATASRAPARATPTAAATAAADTAARATTRPAISSSAATASGTGRAADHRDDGGTGQAVRRRGAAIIRATLLVRERDWHPIEQRLVLRDDEGTSEFIIREAGFDVVPRASLPVAFFEGDDRSEPRHPMEPRHTAEPLRSALPTPADIVTAEVQAMYALHRVGMTAADEIAVHRKPRGVEVVGLTTTDARRRDIVAALSAIPLVRARIRTAEEVIAEMSQTPATEGAPLRFEGAQIEADRLPVQELAAAGAPAAAAAVRATPAVSATSDAGAGAEARTDSSTSHARSGGTISAGASTDRTPVGAPVVGAPVVGAAAAGASVAGATADSLSPAGAIAAVSAATSTTSARTAAATTTTTTAAMPAAATTTATAGADAGTAIAGAAAAADRPAARAPLAGAATNLKVADGRPAIGGTEPTAAVSPSAATAAAVPAAPTAPAAPAAASSEIRSSAGASPDPATPSAAPPPPVASSSVAAGAVSAGARAAVPSDRADQATMRRAREAVQQSLTLLERAWALRRLAEWSRRTNAGDITASTRAMIDAMLRERADAASKALAALDTTVSAVLPVPPSGPAPSSPTTSIREIAPGAGLSSPATPAAAEAAPAPAAAAPAATAPAAAASAETASAVATMRAEADAERPWADIATDFFGTAVEIDRDTRRLFTATTADGAGNGASVSRPEDDARRLRSGLDAAARFLDALQRARPQ